MRYYILKLPCCDPGWCRELNGDAFEMDRYVPVWTDTEDKPDDINKLLEGLFAKFNCNHPINYAAPSMSVGDIIRIQDNDSVKYYVVQGFGFKEVKEKNHG